MARSTVAKILVINTPGMANRGSEAIVLGAIECIAASLPASEVTFLCHHYDTDMEAWARMPSQGLKLKVMRHEWYRDRNSKATTAACSGARFLRSLAQCAVLRAATRMGKESTDPFHECDLVLDLNTDALNEFYQDVFSPIFVAANVLLGIVAGKPVMVCASSVAPFERRRSLRFLLSPILNRTRLITVREEFSLDHLKALGVTKPQVVLTADLSFLVKPCSPERTNEILNQEGLGTSKRPLVGIAVAHKALFAHPEQYVRLVVEASEALAKELDASLIYISNSFSAGVHDESTTIQEIHGKIVNRERIGTIRGEYSAAEMKGIISRCDLMVSAKFHPLLFAASVGVPSVGLVGYHRYKFHGVMGRMLGQEDYLINIDDYPDVESLVAALLSKVHLAWQNRYAVHDSLMEKAEMTRSMALLNGDLIKGLLQQAQG